MRGRERCKKKHLTHAGWRVVDEGRESDRAYRLELRDPAGQPVRISARSRPLAYRRAERRALGGMSPEGPAARA